jgi:hypothetical protein
MKGFLSELMSMVKEHLNDDSEDGDSEFPHLHRTLNTSGFSKLSPEAIAELTARIPKIDPDLPYDNEHAAVQVYKGKRFNRDYNLGPQADLYRRVAAVDPESAPTFKQGGVLVADAAKLAEQQGERIAECLAPYLPAYIFKQDYANQTFGFEVSNREALLALLNNHVYFTFKDFGYRDPETTVEESFINLLLGFTSHINVVFPELGGFVHLGNCGQIFIGAEDDERLANLESLLQPAGEFVAMDY